MGTELERLEALAKGLDLQAVQALARVWARAGDPWGEAIGLVMRASDAALTWAQVAPQLDQLTQDWRPDAAALLAHALAQQPCLAARFPLKGWLEVVANGGFCQQLAWVTRLSIDRQRLPVEAESWSDAAWERIFKAPELAGVRELWIHPMGPLVDLWPAFLASSWVPEVRALRLLWALGSPSLDDGRCRVFANLPWKRLEILELRYHQAGNSAAQALAASPHLVHLRELDLSGNPIQHAGVCALIASALCDRLRKLVLPDHPSLAKEARSLHARPWVALFALLPHIDNGPLEDSILQRIWEHLGDILEGLNASCHTYEYRCAASALGLLVRAPHILAGARSDEERDALCAQAVEIFPRYHHDGVAWNLYVVLRALSMPEAYRAAWLIACLASTPSERTTSGDRRPLAVEMIGALASLKNLTPSLQAQRVKCLQTLSNHLYAEHGWAAIFHLRHLSPSARSNNPKVAEHAKRALANALCASWLFALLDRFGLDDETLREVAASALTAPSFAARAWAFQTLARFDRMDGLMREAVIAALTEVQASQKPLAGHALFAAFEDGWLPQAAQVLAADRFTPEDVHQHAALRPYRTQTLWDAIKRRLAPP